MILASKWRASPASALHSDHGAQYSSQAYWEGLSTYGLQPNMGEIGHVYDNAYAERLVGTLKRE
uniref:Transposase n=1 Tax=Caldilinea aerophila TaxID=133453 RepID=A0A7C1JJU3_9CHLR